MDYLKVVSNSPEETRELGRHLGELAHSGDLYLLVGNLGVGKTCFTQGIARGLGTMEHVLSPTFVLMRELHGRLPLYHIDLYRLDNLEEIEDLGLDDYLYGEGVCVIEWAEKGIKVLPAEYLLVRMNYVSETGRSFEFEPRGKRYLDVIVRLKRLLNRKG